MEKRTVLFVDDEELVLASLRRGLLGEPYNALFASSGKEALKILEQNEVHVLVTDMRMPEMSGLELLKTVREKHPHIVRMVLSGYTQVTTVLTAVNQGEVFRYITKPWKLDEEFRPAIREAIDQYNIQNERRRLVGAGESAAEGKVDGE